MTERNSDTGKVTWMEADINEEDWNVDYWSQTLISEKEAHESDHEAEDESDQRTPKITIFTDSESIVSALESNKAAEKHEWMGKIKEELGKLKLKIYIYIYIYI